MSHDHKLAYRADIDGLRAIAVLAVVVYHAFPSSLRGGFVGVDIFFVISGYLISTILFKSQIDGRLSIVEFYQRRVRRIFPALALVLAATLGAGWFILLAQEYQQLGKHALAGAGFVANLVLWGESGYFDNAAETKPLLHLWSLGIEEQFYLVWPLILLALGNHPRRILMALLLIALVSLVYSQWQVKADPVAAFFSPLTRAWELLAGAMLAWWVVFKPRSDSAQPRSPAWLRNTLAVVGLLLIVFAVLRVHKGLSFPGMWALAPVLGATLLIMAGPSAWLNRVVLSSRLMVWFGLISFPLYLWHWPLFTLIKIYTGEPMGLLVGSIAIAIAVGLAWLTYRYLERPIRQQTLGGTRTILAVLVSVATIGGVIWATQGFAQRAIAVHYASYADSIKITEKSAQCFDIPYAYNTENAWYCSLGDPGAQTTYFAFGDSHALSLLPALDEMGKQQGIRVLFTGTSGCPSVLGVQSMRGEKGIEKHNCQALNERVYQYVQQHKVDKVILVNRWVYYTGSLSRPKEFNAITRDMAQPVSRAQSAADLHWALKETVAQYQALGVDVVLVQDNPQQRFEPKAVLRKGAGEQARYDALSVTRAEHEDNQRDINAFLQTLPVQLLSFDDVLCDETRCPFVRDAQFMYSDDDHLSVFGAQQLVPLLTQELMREF